MTLFEQVPEKDKRLYVEKYNLIHGTNFQTIEEVAEDVIANFPGCMGNLANFRPVKDTRNTLEAENA